MVGARTKQFLTIAVSVAVGGLVPLAWVAADSGSKVTNFDEINVHRVNIVEPNGKYRLVLANSARYPGLFMAGKEYRHHSRSGGGMLFFNDEGDEVGGLSYGSNTVGDKRAASASLMFDQYKQDQTVGILYNEANGRRTAGLRVWDRPEASIQPLMEMSDRAARASTQEEKQRIRGEMLTHANAHGGLGSERFFAGKNAQDAVVRLADKEGRARLLLKVGPDGMPSIEFLDEGGKVVKRITQ